MVGRALQQHCGVRLGGESVTQRLTNTRFPDTSLARQQHGLAFAVAHQAPAFEQQRDFTGAADKVAQLGVVLCLEAACHATFASNPPGLHRGGEALHVKRAGCFQLERGPEQKPGLIRQHDLAGCRLRLQTSREVWRPAARCLLHCRRAGAHLADHHDPGGDANPRLQRAGAVRPQRRHRPQHAQCRPHRTGGVVFMRTRIAEVDQTAVAQQLRHMTFVWRDCRRHGAVERAQDALQVLGVEPRGQRRRAN